MQIELLGAKRSINKEVIQASAKRRNAGRRSLHLPLALERKSIGVVPRCGTLSADEVRLAVAAMLG